jgi:hypothetical protein
MRPEFRSPSPGRHAAELPLENLIDTLREQLAGACRLAPAVELTCDVDAALRFTADARILGRLLEDLLAAAIASARSAQAGESSPPLREVTVTAVGTATALEIEVADSGPPRSAPPAAAIAMAGRCGGSLESTACPEGGTAVTLRLPMVRAMELPRVSRRAA